VSENKPVSVGGTSRRAVVGGLVGLGVGVPLVAACGSENDGGDGSGGSSAAPGTIGKTSEIPVGGAKLYPAEKVMVSQPSEGHFRAFSTVCTHQRCNITQLEGQEIECGCHHSRFRVADGSVAKGPATQPLSELKVTVSGKNLSVSS
jgi:nitrite reductase/ring-hydroxylating ferredoxin subunit